MWLLRRVLVIVRGFPLAARPLVEGGRDRDTFCVIFRREVSDDVPSLLAEKVDRGVLIEIEE